jgi:hypothetical protein
MSGSLSLTFQKFGLKGCLIHALCRVFGEARLLRPASTVDFRISRLTPHHTVPELLKNLMPSASDSDVTSYIREGEELLTRQFFGNENKYSFPGKWNAGSQLQLLLFSLIRLIKPYIVIETGTANGASALAICSGLNANGKGNLYSIDTRNSRAELVPDHLRKYLTVIQTDGSATALQSILNELPVSDEASIFLHDGDHSYLGQLQDFTLAARNNFDFLISDDIDASLVFCDFSEAKGHILLDKEKFVGVLRLAIP